MTEGWNRIAHEALLSHTPVIGSGVGGMAELLDGAGQAIVKDPAQLPQVLNNVLKEKKALGEKGYQYASQFDRQYFTKSWTQLIQNLL